MNKFYLYLLIAAGVAVSFAVGGPLLVFILVIAFALSRLAPKVLRTLDVNDDGNINFDDVKTLFTGNSETSGDGTKDRTFLQSRLRKVWSRLEYKFVLLSVQIQKREREGRQWWHSISPFSHDSKVNALIEELTRELDDRELSMMRHDFMVSVNRIKELESKLANLRASITMKSEAPDGPLHKASEKLEADIHSSNIKHSALVKAFQARLNAYGINMSSEQAEVLLSRVDAGDTCKMISVFAIISGITAQFAEAKRKSGENLDVTKKYYGMYMGLLELQMHIQSYYLDMVDSKYLPGVVSIRDEASALIAKTESKLLSSDPKHVKGYKQNIRSQQFTVEVTETYANALKADRDKVKKAKELVNSVYSLAENTLSTVRVSADLSTLVRQNENLSEQVISLQTPALVPFENLQMKREFEAVTSRIQDRA